MNLTRARKVLLDACINDFIDTIDHHSKLHIARDGFVGFAKMSNMDLVNATCDAGLHEQDDEVNEAMEVLEQSQFARNVGPGEDIGYGPGMSAPDDTPSLDNCDDAGTGEGRFHGRF